MLHTTARSLLSLVLAVTPLAVAAQARPDSTRADSTRGESTRGDSTARRIEPVVVVGTRSPAAVGGAGAVVVRLDSLLLAPAPSLELALREMPFVLVRQNSRGEVELSVRGSDSRQAAVLLDGVPLTLGWDHRTDPSLVPLTGVRRLTLVRGLSSLLGGPNALGGVIEVDLAGGTAGSDASPGSPPPPEVALGTGVDQYAGRGFSAAGSAPVAVGAGTLTARGGASYRERDGFALGRDVAPGGAGSGAPGEGVDPGQPGDRELRTNSDLRQVDGFAALRYERPGGAHAGLAATAYQARRGVPPELHVEEPRLWRYPDVSRVLTILSAGSGVVATPLGHGSLSLSGGVNAGSLEIESFDDSAYTQVTGRETGDERTVTGRAVAMHSLPAGGTVRAAYTRADVRYDERIDDDPTSRYRQELSSTGAEVQYLVLDRALVSGGVVHDAVATPETGGKPSLGDLSRWGWRVGATAPAFGESVRLHTSVSRRARFPALRELYSGALNRFEPNPGLRPERLLGAEVGATLVGGSPARAGLALQAVAFHHRLRDAVVRVSTPENKFRRINRDEIRSTGLELLAGWTPPAHGAFGGSWLAGLSVTGDVVAQRVRVYDRTATPGAPSERRPEHQPAVRGSLELGVPLPLALRGVAGARYTGRQYCVHPDLDREAELGAQAVADVALTRAWPLGGANGGRGLLRELRAVLGLDNVTDATVYDQCGLPQPGRTLRLGLDLR